MAFWNKSRKSRAEEIKKQWAKDRQEAAERGIDRNQVERERMAQAFIQHCKNFGFEPDDLGRRCVGSDGTIYTIAGLNRHSAMHPILMTTQDGGNFLMQADVVLSMLRRSGN